MLGTSHEGEDEGGESAEMGGSVLVGGSERRTEFRSKINEHGTRNLHSRWVSKACKWVISVQNEEVWWC